MVTQVYKVVEDEKVLRELTGVQVLWDKEGRGEIQDHRENVEGLARRGIRVKEDESVLLGRVANEEKRASEDAEDQWVYLVILDQRGLKETQVFLERQV